MNATGHFRIWSDFSAMKTNSGGNLRTKANIAAIGRTMSHIKMKSFFIMNVVSPPETTIPVRQDI